MKLQTIIGLCAIHLAATSPTGYPVAQTKQGAVRGTHLSDAVDGFLGVPYARPPIGDRRFKPPQPLEEGNNSLDASKFGAVCYQFHYNTVMLDNFKETTPESEDCLNLNVFVPRSRSDKELLPALVWMHGGAFGEGGGSMRAYNPTNLVASQNDIVVVTLNYRLNLFGFPNSPALPKDGQNLGLRDMRMALKWLRDNLAHFGGDPSKITLGGQSAGADAAAAFTYAFREDPIARSLFLESGYPAAIGASDDSEFSRIAGIVGCQNKSARFVELECMSKTPAKTLKHAISNKTLNPFGAPAGGNPMVDNLTLFSAEEYARRGATGQFARIPIFIGSTGHEGDSVLNWDPKCGVNKTASDLITLSFFECPISLEAEYRAKISVPVWRYRYTGVFPSVTFFPWLQAYHTADIPMFLGSYPDLVPHREVSKAQAAAAKLLQDAVGIFVRDPDAGLTKKLSWPIYSPNETTLIEMFPNNTAMTHLQDPKKYNSACAGVPPPAVIVTEVTKPAPTC